MIWLASTLLALAGLLAERAVWAARAERQRTALGIERRGRSFRPPPAAWLWVAAAAAALALVGPITAALVAAVGVALRFGLARRRRATDGRRAAEQLAEAVGAMAAGLRAGGSVPQAFAYARDEASEPLRTELAELVDRIDVGTPVEEAIAAWADARGSEDVRLLVGVLDVHRRSGGDLPSVLDGVAGTLRERHAAHREVRALTAQARLSGAILGLLPVAFFGFLLLTSRDEMVRALATPLGATALAVGLGMELLAFVWIRRLVEVR
jgi:tight adherence protein B